MGRDWLDYVGAWRNEALVGRCLKRVRAVADVTVTPASIAALCAGSWAGQQGLIAAGALGLGCAAGRQWRRRKNAEHLPEVELPCPPRMPLLAELDDSNGAQSLVRQLLEQNRYSLLLRPQIAPTLTSRQRQVAQTALEEGMSLVPRGEVVVGQIDEAIADGRLSADLLPRYRAQVSEIPSLLLDRYCVSNRDYYEFVRGGGYSEMSIWEEEIWPAVLDFVDRTGQPGPRFWRDSCYPSGLEQHPVCGVSWYEASAYARWVGKRLPTDAEWVKAASWPVKPGPDVWVQRKYPWGNSFDTQRANLAGSGHEGTVPVDAYDGGLTVGGACQMVGNVWEWMYGHYGRADDVHLSLPTPMRSLRGGAYDTFFESQATCHFQSGDNPLVRKHNVGFRLALSVCDLAPLDRGGDLLVEETDPAELCEAAV